MKEEKKERIAIYSRKSKFTGKGESIENQIELCKQYIRTHFPNCGDGDILIYEDEGFSGGNTERPRFKKMMIDAKAKKFSAIVCYRLDRISRNIGDFAKLIEELESLGIAFVSIKEQFDTSSPMGRAMMYISSVFSQLERETIAERIRDNMHELSKTGRWLGGTSPTGYVSESMENVTVDGKIKRACRLKLVPEEAEIVKQIYAKFLETNSLSKTETYFLQNDYKTKTGRKFTRFAFRNILTNPVYMIADADAYHYMIEKDADLFAEESTFDGQHGIMAYNRTIQKAGKTNQVRPIDEWIVAVGKHTGLISGAEWIKVQKCLEQNRSKTFRKPRSNTALLSGILFCADCDNYMRPKITKRLDAHGEQMFTYLCETKEKSRSHKCTIKNANGIILDKAVCNEIKKLGEDSSEFIRQLESAKKKLMVSHEEYDESLDRLRKNLADNDRDIAALVDSLKRASGTSAEEYIVRQIDEQHNKGELLKRRIEELESITAGHALSDIEFDVIRQMLSSFSETLDTMDVEQKRAALRSFVKKVVWDGENVHLYLFGADDNDGIDLPPADFTPDDGDGDGGDGGDDAEPSDGANSPPYTFASNGGLSHETLSEGSKYNSNTKVTFSRLRHKRLKLHIPDAANNFIPYEILPTHMGDRKVLKAKRLCQAMRLCADAPITVADKLRYARLSAGLLQDDLAAKLGIDRATLLRYENGQVSEENMQVDILLQVASVCGMDRYYCCDPYHIFIAEDAGKQIKQYRKRQRLTQVQFVEKLGVALTTIKRWEGNVNKPPLSVWGLVTGSL